MGASHRRYPLTRWFVFSLLVAVVSWGAVQLATPPDLQIASELSWKTRAAVLGFAAGSTSKGKFDPTLAKRWIKKARKSQILLLEKAFVIGEQGGGMFAFLRKKVFFAHSDPKLQGKALRKDSDRDKRLFDLSNEIKMKSLKDPKVVLLKTSKDSLQVRAVASIAENGKHKAVAVLVLRAPPKKAATHSTARTYMISYLLLVMLGGLLFLLLRGPWGHLIALGGLAAAAFYPYVQQVDLTTRAQKQLLQSRQNALQELARFAPETSAAWFKALLPPAQPHPFVFKTPAKQQPPKISIEWKRSRATQIEIPRLPYFSLGFGAVFLYFLFAWGLFQRLFRTLLTYRHAYIATSPAMFGMIVLVFIPFSVGIGLSFFTHTTGGHYTFVGLDNFRSILFGSLYSLSHPLNFYFTLGVTVMWTVLNVALHVSIGLGLALLLKNPLLRMKAVYRVLLILPWAIPNYITALIWKGMFHKQFGSINTLLVWCGFEPIEWFSSFWPAFTANLVTNTWLGFPFMMVISLGALQSIPADLYEAADVDGASRWQQFYYITLPLLKPALFPAIILGVIWTFNMFNIIYLVSGGEPGGATDILITEAYRWAFQRGYRYGYAAAYSTIIFLILLGYSLTTNRMTKATEGI